MSKKSYPSKQLNDELLWLPTKYCAYYLYAFDIDSFDILHGLKYFTFYSFISQ